MSERRKPTYHVVIMMDHDDCTTFEFETKGEIEAWMNQHTIRDAKLPDGRWIAVFKGHRESMKTETRVGLA